MVTGYYLSSRKGEERRGSVSIEVQTSHEGLPSGTHSDSRNRHGRKPDHPGAVL